MTNEQYVSAQRIKGEIANLVDAKIRYEYYVRLHTPPGFWEEFPFLDESIEKLEAALKEEFKEHVEELIENLQNQFEKL